MDFNNIYITGDTHGEFNNLMKKAIAHRFTNKDLVIILGDVGLNYYGNKKDDSTKRILSDIPSTFLCIHGNHEMRPTSKTITKKYEKINWQNDIAYVEKKYPRLIMAEDGSRYKINGHEFLIIGGAYSVDKEYRLKMGYQWFNDEQLTDEEKENIMNKIITHGQSEDIILAHTCPYKAIPKEEFIPGIDQSKVDNSTELFLQSVTDITTFNDFYCGHWHINKTRGPIHFLFDDVIKL